MRFFLAFNFIPKKQVNIRIDEKYYEIIDNTNNDVHIQETILFPSFTIQSSYIEANDAQVALSLGEYEEQIEFLQEYQLKIEEKEI